jgi:hypothetical protein
VLYKSIKVRLTQREIYRRGLSPLPSVAVSRYPDGVHHALLNAIQVVLNSKFGGLKLLGIPEVIIGFPKINLKERMEYSIKTHSSKICLYVEKFRHPIGPLRNGFFQNSFPTAISEIHNETHECSD